ncbi:hypothetical protein TSUD_313030 [Trifolium subterraneum]|uniref:Uncharacterized protein n=1 Tax=Trifolium subterraneum TaxID=3900 RepID=A0A2Z6M6X7_TRISU|nr:hypothetical protein TSUD_313030 [Trifolium subterraneum]
MDSGGDMHDANDIEYYSDYDDDDAAEDYFDDDDDDSHPAKSRRIEQSFTILKESDIRQRQEDDITFVGIARKRLTVPWIATPCQSGF